MRSTFGNGMGGTVTLGGERRRRFLRYGVIWFYSWVFGLFFMLGIYGRGGQVGGTVCG